LTGIGYSGEAEMGSVRGRVKGVTYVWGRKVFAASLSPKNKCTFVTHSCGLFLTCRGKIFIKTDKT
jgi:hypothetical protein